MTDRTGFDRLIKKISDNEISIAGIACEIADRRLDMTDLVIILTTLDSFSESHGYKNGYDAGYKQGYEDSLDNETNDMKNSKLEQLIKNFTDDIATVEIGGLVDDLVSFLSWYSEDLSRQDIKSVLEAFKSRVEEDVLEKKWDGHGYDVSVFGSPEET